MWKRIFAGVTLAAGLVAAAGAQTQNRVDVERDWSVFEASSDGGKVCWIVSSPTRSVALRSGKQVEVSRGDIFLMVAVRPAAGVDNEVSYIAGYPFKGGSEVEAKVRGTTYRMFTDGENAWAPTPADDSQLVKAFRAGVDVIVEGVSTRGTTTVDTFSLLGFTAALESAQGRCK
jgi:invasion protein IalB